MALDPGSSIGSYEILTAIGKGGMGEVYLARDAKLKRDVAIKALPDAFALDADRVARFQREAEALATLNHPNIGAIYGLEESAGSRFLVLELIEGETLGERLKRGALPVDEALRLALQMAAALEAAHEKGVVHRDLKPANIKITPEGSVKVLDFGLAKAWTPESSPATSNSPTMMSMAATQQGLILGTAAYMSPEQAKGRSVDKRTDIFSFGCVLYEMLTGLKAFDGEDVTEILSRILQRDADWTRLPSNTPPRIRELLRLCLEKDVRKRRRDVGDVHIDIEHSLKEPATERAKSPALAWIAAAMLAVVSTAFGTLYFRSGPADAPEMRVEINTPRTSQPLHFAISPDGSRLVFVASGDGAQRLWIRPLDAVTAQPLTGTEGAEYPFWSPDSHSIGFFASGTVRRIDIGGGPPQALADAPAGRGGAWGPDGTILFAATNASPLSRIPASGGQPVQVTKLDLPRQGSHRLPQFLPDGRHFLFFAQGNPDGQGIYLGSLDAGETKRLTAAEAAGAYAEPGLLVFNRQGALVARGLDVTAGALTGDPVTVADAVSYDGTFNLGGFSVSTQGRITYRPGGTERRQLTWFDRTGRPLGMAGEPDVNALVNPALSPDSRRVAVTRTVQNNVDVWLVDLLRGGTTRFTFDAANDQTAVWSPDGTRIAFGSNRKGIYDFYMKPSSGAGSEEVLLESPHVKAPMDWSQDGRFILYADADPKTGFDLWALPMSGANASPVGRSHQEIGGAGEAQGRQAAAVNNASAVARSDQGSPGERKPVVVVNTPFQEVEGQFSPDGRWVAYQSNESGQFQIYVQPFPGPGGKWQVSTAGGTQPRWRADGKELFFIAPDAKLMAASVQTLGSTFDAGPPTALFQTRTAVGGLADLTHQYAVSRDGRFLINMPVEQSANIPITLILNWKGRAK